MEILRSVTDIPEIRSSVITIGSFDGLHRGHQEIIKKVVSQAESLNIVSAVITFDQHPRHVLDKDRKLPLLMSIEKKIEILEKIGVKKLLIIRFTREFSRTTAEAFMTEIIEKYFHPIHLIVGHDHHFGHDRKGSPQFLMEYCLDKKFTCEVIPPVKDKEIILSSTHIRKLLQEGFVRRASFELGWVYGFRAQVVRGTGRGKDLSFPTANFVPIEKNQLLPKMGVYFCRGKINSKSLYGMCNLGVRPTFNEKDFVAEIHFFSSELNDIYGSEIDIEFLERIRDEIKFDNAEDLIQQLKKDKNYSMQLMKKYS